MANKTNNMLRAKISPVAASIENTPRCIAKAPNNSRKANLDILDMVSGRMDNPMIRHEVSNGD